MFFWREWGGGFESGMEGGGSSGGYLLR